MKSSAEGATRAVEGFVSMHMPAQYGYLRIIRQLVMDLSIRAGLSDFNAAQLEMAVDEASANVIEHSYGGEVWSDREDTRAGIHLHVIQQRGSVVVKLYDFGKGFDFEGHEVVSPQAYLDGQRDRGLGMYIIRRFVDDLTYERGTPSGNCLTLIKRA